MYADSGIEEGVVAVEPNSKTKHTKVIKFMQDHGGIIDWRDNDITLEIMTLINEAIPEVITSYSDSETYMLNDESMCRRKHA